MRVRALLLFIPLLVACASGPTPETGSTGGAVLDPGPALREAAGQFQQGNPEGCLVIAEQVLQSTASAGYRAWAHYYAGEALFQLQRYYEAHLHYEILIARYPGFSELSQVIRREYAIGCAFVDGRQERPVLGFSVSAEELGYEMLEVLLKRFESDRFDYGRYLMAEYQYQEEEYPQAVFNYRRLIRDYPESEWVDLAYFRIAQCTLAANPGYAYDCEPARVAEKLFQDYLRRYPTGNRVEEAEEILGEIRSSLAERYLDMAWYYRERADHPHGAAVYYATVLRRYPESPEAEEAGSLLEEIVAEHPGTPAATEAEQALDRHRAP